MSSRVCAGCGRRVPDDFDACLGCGADIPGDGRAAAASPGWPLPPAPPPSAPLPVWGPLPWTAAADVHQPYQGSPAPGVTTAARPAFTRVQDTSRWLAAGGQAVVAFVDFVGVLLLIRSELTRANAGGLVAMISLRCGFAFVLGQNAWRLIVRPDRAAYVSVILGSLAAVVWVASDVRASIGNPVSLAITAIPVVAMALGLASYALVEDVIPDRAART